MKIELANVIVGVEKFAAWLQEAGFEVTIQETIWVRINGTKVAENRVYLEIIDNLWDEFCENDNDN